MSDNLTRKEMEELLRQHRKGMKSETDVNPANIAMMLILVFCFIGFLLFMGVIR
jgi:hypothetical protein